ncbi:uncharacterized protein LOC127837029 isoform X2 [Dreissena polymorpha]|uniref:uncharacterized protein LOC127837029 isoform X2 n=1 Tax=Dreissena polymorpha TaxID=45954 RepID=UPI002264B3A5|nr:uncharacterized protein LOC127837029 isoform X2 [Dreissena polymorpha]
MIDVGDNCFLSNRVMEEVIQMPNEIKERGDSFHLFDWGKSKRQKKLQQWETMARLARTIEEQTKYLHDMSQDNREHAQALTTTRVEINHLSERRRELEAALSKTHGELADTRERLEGLDRRLLEANMFLVNMKTTQETLTSTLVEQEEMIKGLQADVVGLTDELADERSRRCDMDIQLVAMQHLVREMRAQAHKAQQQLEIEIECLKFNVLSLTRTVKKKIREIDQLNRDKLLIVSYYTKRFGKVNNVDPQDEQDVMSNEEHDKLVIKVQKRISVLRLESALYRRRLLIDQLVILLQTFDPNFELDTNPYYRCYLTDDEMLVPQLQYEDMVDIYTRRNAKDDRFDPEDSYSDTVVMTTSSDTRNNMIQESKGTNTKILYLRRNL